MKNSNEKLAAFTIPLLVVLLLSLIFSAGCIENQGPQSSTTTSTITTTSSTSTTTTQPTGDFEVHEWGVLAGCSENDSYFLTSRPQRTLLVKQPVIYFHSNKSEKENISFNVTAHFTQGKVTDTYPTATSIFKDNSSLKWEGVNVVGSCSEALKSNQPPEDHLPLEEIIDTLNQVDADCLEIEDTRERFLFYEGMMSFENKVKISYNYTSQKATLTNKGDYSVHNLAFTLTVPDKEEGDAPFTPKVYHATLSKLKPGEEKILEAKEGQLNQTFLEKDLQSLGFTIKESQSFSQLWEDTFFYPTNKGFSNLVYRLPQHEYEEMISLDISPEPNKIVRSLYVRVDLNRENFLKPSPDNESNSKKTSNRECTSDEDCAVAGCSSQVCTTKEKASQVVTTCEYKSWYDCLDYSSCSCISNTCKWEKNKEFQECMENHGK